MQRNTILIGHLGGQDQRQLFSSNYLRWTAAERDYLFSRLWLTDVSSARASNDLIPKIATSREVRILQSIGEKGTRLGQLKGVRYEMLYFHDSGESYWTKTLWDKPIAYRNGKRVEPAQWFVLEVPAEDRPFVYLLLNANLLYWLWTVYTDCRHMTRGFIESLALPANRTVEAQLISKLQQAYSENTSLFEKRPGYKSPEIKVQNFKPIIDEIDCVLAQHYGFTDEELDFIINYDIKYRMGRDAGSTADEAG